MNKATILQHMGFEMHSDICYGYKIFNAIYKAPAEWVLKEDSILKSKLDRNPKKDCAVGIHFTTFPNLKDFYLKSTLANEHAQPMYMSDDLNFRNYIGKSNLYPLTVWKVAAYVKHIVIPWRWYSSPVKIRASEIELICHITYNHEIDFLRAFCFATY